MSDLNAYYYSWYASCGGNNCTYPETPFTYCLTGSRCIDEGEENNPYNYSLIDIDLEM